jgi:hypothetical protein
VDIQWLQWEQQFGAGSMATLHDSAALMHGFFALLNTHFASYCYQGVVRLVDLQYCQLALEQAQTTGGVPLKGLPALQTAARAAREATFKHFTEGTVAKVQQELTVHGRVGRSTPAASHVPPRHSAQPDRPPSSADKARHNVPEREREFLYQQGLCFNCYRHAVNRRPRQPCSASCSRPPSNRSIPKESLLYALQTYFVTGLGLKMND